MTVFPFAYGLHAMVLNENSSPKNPCQWLECTFIVHSRQAEVFAALFLKKCLAGRRYRGS